ncbi:MAG: COG1361 family protein [Minisyncoccota bacterium]
MSPQNPENDIGSLERARERLYEHGHTIDLHPRPLLTGTENGRELPHQWEKDPFQYAIHKGKRHVRFASIFFIGAFLFFLVSLGLAGYIFLIGGNSVSVDKISMDIQGPTTIAAGDTVPLALTITNKNATAIENATIEIDFPSGTRDATNVLQDYPRYTENLGTLESGASVTRSVKAVVFGGAGQALSIPISFSYGSAGSNAVFVKKSSYALTISTTPLSLSVDAPTETVSGLPFTFTLTVRSNATVPLDNIVLTGDFPFGFTVTSSSVPLNNSSFLIGTLQPGAQSTITLTGTLAGQESEQPVFHFTVGTAKTAHDQTLAVTYMTQDAAVTIAAPFINATLALNGDTSPSVIVSPGTRQSVTLSYANTLSTNVTNATVAIAISGAAVDYNSIQTTSGFYRSSDHTVVFSQDTDPALAQLAPGASGLGSFTFMTLPTNVSASTPTITFTISVSGTRVGQANVPEQISASATKTAKVATSVVLSASSLHASGPLGNSGPVPPRAGQTTTYTIVWNALDEGSSIAGGTVSATLPSYVSYTGQTAGAGSFSYDAGSHVVTWSTGDIAQGSHVQGAFQVSFTPSTSQVGNVPQLVGGASFSGYDRFAGIQVSTTADPVTTETKGDPGYISSFGTVQ